MKNKKYKIADISIELDENNKPKIFWVNHVGWHASQGGMEFGFGSSGALGLENALDYLEVKINMDIDDIIEEIVRRESE